VESFFLPKHVLVKLNDRKPEKSKLVASGFFDLGPDAVDLTKPASLTVGGQKVAIAGLVADPSGKFTHKGDGISFSVKPSKAGSSRAKFKLKMTGDLRGKVDPDAAIEMRFTSDAIDGRGVVTLTKGRYSYRKVRGTLVAPNLYLTKSKGKLKGGGKDALTVIVGMATDGKTPAAADVSITFAGKAWEIDAAEFEREGDAYVYRGAAGGIGMCRLDYGKEQMTVKAKGIDLGTFAEGPQPVVVVLSVGTDERAVGVRMVKKGKGLKY
jgi:hypothetical protein